MTTKDQFLNKAEDIADQVNDLYTLLIFQRWKCLLSWLISIDKY